MRRLKVNPSLRSRRTRILPCLPVRGRFGKIDPADFFAISEDLIEPIVDEASLSGVYRTRSVTYVANSPDQTKFSEGLAIPQDVDSEGTVDIHDILAGGENARVEFKASAF